MMRTVLLELVKMESFVLQRLFILREFRVDDTPIKGIQLS